MVIYDTVGSFGVAGTDLNPGYNLNIAPNVEHVLSISAESEQRAFFPFSSATASTSLNETSNDGRIVQIGLPGAHSNIGGGYPGAYQFYGLDMGYSFLSQLGVPMSPLATSEYDYNVQDYSTDSMRLQDSNWKIDNFFQALHLESHARVVYPAQNPPPVVHY